MLGISWVAEDLVSWNCLYGLLPPSRPIYDPRRLITVFKIARDWSVYLTTIIQPVYLHLTSLKLILILYFHYRLCIQSDHNLSGIPTSSRRVCRSVRILIVSSEKNYIQDDKHVHTGKWLSIQFSQPLAGSRGDTQLSSVPDPCLQVRRLI